MTGYDFTFVPLGLGPMPQINSAGAVYSKNEQSVYYNGMLTYYNYPGGLITGITGITPNNILVGNVYNGAVYEGLVYDGGTYTTISLGSDQLGISGVSDAGVIFGDYLPANNGRSQGFEDNNGVIATINA